MNPLTKFAQTPTHVTLSDGCSRYAHRINVCGFDPVTQAVFVDTLDQAQYVRVGRLAAGVKTVDIYDTVEGLFYEGLF